MIKIGFVLTLSAVVASAWFLPSFDFSGDDNTHVDKNFVRDAQKEVVVNKSTSKMYSDVIPSKKMHFYGAWQYCQDLELAGHDDWRVITKEEARDLLELSRRKIKVKHAFRNVKEELYWTSTRYNFGEAWFVDFDLGRYSTKKDTNKFRTICVRDTKK